ncbi:MAG: class I SAM-dependent methyltransferase [Candidatus Bathyarchaeota archaeon]
MKQFKCPKGLKGRIVAESMNRGHSALTDWGLKKVEIKPQFKILDVGCGGGKTISKLASLAFKGKVYGIDYSSDMVEYSKEVNNELIAENRVLIIESSVENLNFPDGFFDLVTGVETYYFWSNLLKAFNEIKRVLKQKGKLLLINEMIKDGIYEVENAEIIADTNVNLVSLSEIKSMLQSIGFTNVNVFSKKKSPWNTILAQKQ